MDNSELLHLHRARLTNAPPGDAAIIANNTDPHYNTVRMFRQCVQCMYRDGGRRVWQTPTSARARAVYTSETRSAYPRLTLMFARIGCIAHDKYE